MTKAISGEGKLGWEQQYEGRTAEISLWGDDPIPVLSQAVTFLRQANVKTLADIGCGDGRNLEVFCLEGFNCAGVDISSAALEQACKRMLRRGLSAFLVRGSMTDLPFASNTVPSITCFDVFGQITNSEDAISEFRRVLIPGGPLLLTAFAEDDGTFGEGIQVSNRVFEYKDTIFKYFVQDEVQDLFVGNWDLLSIDKYEWDDPPHGDFRPVPHHHSSYFAIASKR